MAIVLHSVAQQNHGLLGFLTSAQPTALHLQ